ncbi:MAG: hypothetical protein AB8C40_07625 [Gammaproteobacteria bacterium]
MRLRFASTCLSITLMIIAAPASAHSGHTNIIHNHSGIEYLLVLFVIAGIIYHHFKH